MAEGETVHCVIALGYGENQGVQHPLKPVEKFYELASGQAGVAPQWFLDGMKAAMLAPTAINQQKFKFILHSDSTVEARALFSFAGYAAMDLGIVKCHFEAGAGVDNFKWHHSS